MMEWQRFLKAKPTPVVTDPHFGRNARKDRANLVRGGLRFEVAHRCGFYYRFHNQLGDPTHEEGQQPRG